jgi:Chalcone isomerase-like
VESTSQDAAQIIGSEQVKRVRMSMLRDLEKSKIVDAITEGFEKNAKAQLAALKERLDKLTASIPDLKKGDELVLTYVPGKGTRIESKGGQALTVEGKDFADALFSVWLGKHPVDGDLKKALLGKAED